LSVRAELLAARSVRLNGYDKFRQCKNLSVLFSKHTHCSTVSVYKCIVQTYENGLVQLQQEHCSATS